MEQSQSEFRCSGSLRAGGHWGCGRRFPHVEAFARHLKTESGRKCIQPLHVEEQQQPYRMADPLIQDNPNSSFLYPSLRANEALSGYSLETESSLLIQEPSQPFNRALVAELEPTFGLSPLTEPDCRSFGPCSLATRTTGNETDRTNPGASYTSWWKSYMSAVSTMAP